MLATRRSRLSAGAVLVLLLLLSALGYYILSPKPAGAGNASATLTIFTGTVQVERAGASAFAVAKTGAQLAGGDQLRTAADTKAAVNYPDGSVMRLDSSSSVTITSLSRSSNTSLAADIKQTAGKTWSNVKQPSGGGSYKVKGPNSTTAEVRGTEFSFIIEIVNGKPVVRIDAWSGSIDVSNDRGRVSLSGAQSSTVTASSSAPSAAAPIPATDPSDAFTLFNNAADQIPPDAIAESLGGGSMNQGEVTALQAGVTTTEPADIQMTLAWPGSKFELCTFEDTHPFNCDSSPTPTLSIELADAAIGSWAYTVRDLQSNPKENWVVIVSIVKPSKEPADATLPQEPAA